MTWYPVSGTPLVALKANTGFANNYVLKFYVAGTNNPLLCAFNRTATDPFGDALVVDFIRFNEFGYSVNNSGGVCIPHVEVEYKAVLYKNETDANANDTNRAEYVVDYVRPGLIGFVEAGGQNNSSLITYQASATAVSSDVQTVLRRFISVKDFGAIGNGIANDSNAIDAAMAVENKDVIFTSGTYLTNGLEVVTDYQSIHFHGDVTLKASANSTYIFHQQASFSKHSGTFYADSGGRTGVYGLVVGPDNLSDNLATDGQLYNILPGVSDIGKSGCAELCVVQPSPSVIGGNVGNLFPYIYATAATRGLWLKSPATTGGASLLGHAFNFVSCTSGNTGIQIDNGSKNTFGQVNLDGISVGSSPNATPTGIKIRDVCPVTGAKNRDNDMPLVAYNNNSRDLDLGNNDNFIGGIPTASVSVSSNQTFLQRQTWGQKDLLDGSVNGTTGAAVSLPSGWTSAKTSTGEYRVTHNLGTTNYTVLVCSTSFSAGTASVYSKSSNSFDVSGSNISTLSSTDVDFDLIVIKR